MGKPLSKSQGTKTSIQLEPHQVLLRPLVTEKGVFQSEANNQYAFEVNPLSTKADVQRAIEGMFEVKVKKVRIQNRASKPRRYRFRRGHTKNWKKAIVTLDSEHRINFF